MGAFDHLIPKTQAAPANRFSHLVPSAPATPRVNLMDVINQEPTELTPESAAILARTSPATAIQAGIPLPMPAPDPEGFVANVKDFGAGVMEAFTGVGDVVRSAAADAVGLNEQLGGALNVRNILNPLRLYDLATKAARGELPGPKPEYAGNIRAMIEQPGARLPVDEFLGEVAQTNPALATVGKFAQTTAQTAPLLAIGGLPQWLQRLAALGFSAQMVSHAPELARELGTEMGKPPEERDLDKLTTLTSDAIATGLFAPLAGYGGVKDIALTKGDARRVAIRDLAKQLKQEPLLEIPFELPLRPRATPMRARPGVESMDIVQSPFEAPWVREHARTLIDRAILEAQGRAVTQPGELPALELLRRAIGPSEIVTGEPTIRVDRPGGGPAQGGRISFAGEAEARGVPSARQSALPRTVEQIQRERAQDAIIARQVQESREPQRPQAPERRLPAETERRNRTGEGGDEPPSPAAEVVPKPPPKPPASPRAAEIERISQQSPDEFLNEFRKPGGLTKAAYDFAETLTKEDLASLEAAREAAIAEQTRILKEAEGLTDRAAKLDAMQRGTGFGFKQQFFNEAAKWRRALDEAKETGAKTPEEFRAIEQKYGVGISEKTELMDAAKRLGIIPEAKPGPTGKIPKPQPGMVRLYQGSGGAEGAGTAGSFWTKDVNRARSYGPNIRYVDVPEQAFKAGQEAVAKRGQAPGSDAIIPDELARQAKEFTGEVPERVIDLDTPVGEPAQPPAAPAAAAPPEAKPVPTPTPNVEPASGAPLSATDALINKLERLKVSNNPGEVFSLPDPKIFQSYGKAFWNTGIDVAIASIRAGRSIAQAIDTAIARMRDFARERGMSVDWKGVRENLTAILREETGIPKPPSAPVTTGAGEGGTRMRLSAEHATTSPRVPKQVQKRIATAPESFYEPQSMARVEEAVSAMSPEQLSAIGPESDLYTAAKLEQADRLFKAGQDEAGYQVFVELEKQGTRWGQLINQFKLLQGSTPEGVVRVINEKLKRSKRDPLTKEQAERVKTTVKKSKEKDAALDEATEVWLREPTAENARAAETALDAANQAALELQKLASRFQPRSLWSTLKSLLQGNLLTPISEVANLVGNTSFLPFRMGSRAVGATIDLIDSAIRQRPRQLTVQPLSGTRQAALGMMRSLREMGQIAVRGTGDTIKGETRAGLHPVRAWMTQFARNPDVPTVGGKVPLTDRIGLLLEGTLGIPAEIMLRGLAIGDVPFRRAAEARIIAEQLRLKGVPRDQWSFAQKFPELFFDRATMEQMRQESLGAIFQGKSTTLQTLNQLIRNNWLTQRGVKPELIDFFVATVAPYKLTPWKITGEILSFNPIVALARTAWEAKRGNIRAAEINAGKFVMGSMLTGAAVWLYDKGLLAPSLDSRNEAQKARILSGEVLPPNHINLSGLRRALSGGSPEFQAGDKTVDVFRAGGLAGSMMYLVANIGRELEKRPDTTQADLAGSIIRQSTLEQAQFAMNQSYLSGIEGLLTAIRDGNTDSYVRQYMRTVLAIPFPNTLDTFSRATREHKVDVSEDKFSKQIENLVRSKLGFAGLDDYLPLRRGLWGEPLPETPKSRTAFFYHFFDIFKGKQVTDDPVSLMLYKLWRDTNDSRAIPPLPERTMTHRGVTYQLTPEQHSRYAELVGRHRRYYIDQVMQNPEFKKASTEMKLRVLSIVWDGGRERGKSEFIKEEEGNLQRKLK